MQVSYSKKNGVEVKVVVSYQNLENFKHYCKINQISIIDIKFEQEISIIIEIAFEKKEKILYEIQEKQLNIQKMEILKEKNIKKQ